MGELTDVGKIIEGMAVVNPAPGDYRDDEGFLVCGKCHTRRQMDVEVPTDFRPTGLWRVPTNCKCRQAEADEERRLFEAERFRQRMDELRRDGITDPAYLAYTFDQDDRRNPKLTDVCRKYVDNWEEMRADNIGILFYGDVGTGKSFLACCVANALLDELVAVCVTNFPRLMNSLQGFDADRQKVLDRLQRHSLLVIDDLGVERDTSYSLEQVYSVVDARSRAGKPLIVTTNLSLKDMENPPNLAYKRIYDRILEMCPIRLKLTGESRRVGNAAHRTERARKILGLTQ